MVFVYIWHQWDVGCSRMSVFLNWLHVFQNFLYVVRQVLIMKETQNHTCFHYGAKLFLSILHQKRSIICNMYTIESSVKGNSGTPLQIHDFTILATLKKMVIITDNNCFLPKPIAITVLWIIITKGVEIRRHTHALSRCDMREKRPCRRARNRSRGVTSRTRYVNIELKGSRETKSGSHGLTSTRKRSLVLRPTFCLTLFSINNHRSINTSKQGNHSCSSRKRDYISLAIFAYERISDQLYKRNNLVRTISVGSHFKKIIFQPFE